jgi:LysM repeat protein
MEPGAMQRRRGAVTATRILAVLALVAGAIVLVVVIASSVGGSGDSSSSAGNGTHTEQKGPKNKYYVVQPGDTFGGIASKENVPIARLEQLNPNLDTQLLPEKGCVNLVPKGCKVLANGG